MAGNSSAQNGYPELLVDRTTKGHLRSPEKAAKEKKPLCNCLVTIVGVVQRWRNNVVNEMFYTSRVPISLVVKAKIDLKVEDEVLLLRHYFQFTNLPVSL